MKNSKGYVYEIESCGMLDGPGIRTVVFLKGCNLRCKYCHNPESWIMDTKFEMDSDLLVEKVLRNKAYFNNGGGVTFSGGEPLDQCDYLEDVIIKLKEENVNVCIDTSGYVTGGYEKVVDLADLLLLDIKATDEILFKEITGGNFVISDNFVKYVKRIGKPVWIRQVIIPDVNDNMEYMVSLKKYIKGLNIGKVEFLPFHNLAFSKYENLGIKNFYKDKKPMDIDKCNKLYEEFLKLAD